MNRQGKNGIPYVDYTWNPVTGCYHGCGYCFARTIAERFAAKDYEGIYSTILYDEKLHVNYCEHDERVRAMPGSHSGPDEIYKVPFPYGFMPTLYYERLQEPLKVKKPARIFVTDMGDLFGDWVPTYWINMVLDTVNSCPQHTFLFLTKNPKRYREFDFPKNAWIGTSVENQKAADERIPELLKTIAIIRWVSCEPLLGPVNLERIEPKGRNDVIIHALSGEYAVPFTVLKDRPRVHWVVAGGQTGPGARPCNPDWVRNLRDQCHGSRTPFYFKAWGEWAEPFHAQLAPQIYEDKQYETVEPMERQRYCKSSAPNMAVYKVGKKAAGRSLNGRIHKELPDTGRAANE